MKTAAVNILADGSDDHARRESGGEVFETVHHKVDAAVLKRQLQLFRKQILLADLTS